MGSLRKETASRPGSIFSGVFLILHFILGFLPLWTVRVILFAIFGIAPSLIALIGIGDESLLEALGTYIGYRRQKKILPYSLAACTVKTAT